jgi:hypothetical protein
MRVSFMQRVDGPDANSAFQRIKAEKGMCKFIRISVPPSAGHGIGPTTFAWDILSWECHLDPNDKRHKQSHVYHEKINLWWSVEYRKFIERAFERLYHADGVCGVVQVFDVDSGIAEDTWLFFGWTNVNEAEEKEAA